MNIINFLSLYYRKILGKFREQRASIMSSFVKGWHLYFSHELNLLLLLNRDNYIDFLISQYGVYNQALIKAIDRIVCYENIEYFFDIGSNIGQMSLYVCKKFPQTRVYSFEPIYSNFIQQEAQKLINNLDYKLVNIALSDQTEILLLYPPRKDNIQIEYGKYNTGMYSIDPDKYRDSNTTINVPAEKFDRFLSSYDISDTCSVLVKIDVEGSELKVLNGMNSFLTRNGTLFIILELNFSEKLLYFEVVKLLINTGYGMYDLTFTKIEDFTNLKDGDYLFCKAPPRIGN